MTDSRQADLPGEPVAASALLRIEAQQAPLTPLQREFNRLSGLIEQLRAELAGLQKLGQDLDSRVAREGAQLDAALAEAQRALLQSIAQLLAARAKPPVSKRQRRVLEGELVILARALLELRPDENDLLQLHDLYSNCSWEDLQQSRANERQTELEFAEQMASASFGTENVVGLGARSIEELFETLAGHFEAEHENAEAERLTSKRERLKARRAQAAQERADAHAAETKLSVREVYRQLVSNLHPDREPDPLRREHKTQLMQRINQACAAGDLLGLLTLQVEVQQLDADSLAQLPGERLTRFIDVLKTQVKTLRTEIEEHVARLRQQSGQTRARNPKQFMQSFNEHVRERRGVIDQLQRRASLLPDPRHRAHVVDMIAMETRFFEMRENERRAQDAQELEMLLVMAQFQQRGPGRQGRGR